MRLVKHLLTVLVITFSASAAADDLFEVTTCSDLESIGNGDNFLGATHTDEWPLDGNYVLTNDIDCQNKDFIQIAATESSPFTGSLNGNGYKVSNISGDNGIFGHIGILGSISNITFDNINIKTSRDNVGILIDSGEIVSLNNIFIIHSSIINEGDNTGCFAGNISFDSGIGRVVGLHASDCDLTGLDKTGGVFGQSVGIMNDIHTAFSTINGNDYTGGIAGKADASEFIGHLGTSDSTISGRNYVGGLVGYFGESYSDGVNELQSNGNKVYGKSYVGGLFGASSSFSNADGYSTSDVVSMEGDYIGGLYGYLTEPSPSSYANLSFSGNLSASSTATNVGRLIGKSGTPDMSLWNSYYFIDQVYIASVENSASEQPSTEENLSSHEWYRDVLGFSDQIWKYPLTLSYQDGPELIFEG